MIPDSLFRPQLGEVERVLKKLSLLAERLSSPNISLGAADFRGKTYRQQYELIIRELAYDFRLSDQSLLRFSKSGSDIHEGSLSYGYYESPVAVMSYEAFVGFTAGANVGTREYVAALEQAGSELMSEYEDYVMDADLKAAVTPLRYDYKALDYRAGIHPASHVHFGCENDIRIGTRRIVTPLAFTLFVVRQRYPSAWVVFQNWEKCSDLCRNVREHLDEVDQDYWAERDEQEMFFH